MSDSSINGVGGSLQGVQAASSLKLVKYAESAADKVTADVNDKAAISGAVKKLNEYVAPALQTIEFSIDDDSDRIIVKVVDTETQKVLRQIPNEEVLAISKTLDKLRGLVVRQTA
ncbi:MULTISPECIES: flagellar protein FlaG [unclassified Methylophilus]|jgi:flagellar protein FlaG|uniref:flagellar protein FlaG n=1 Tax=unclassified Methylophilus TaxID=2630143 RepID=UPI00035D71A5|nr:MULTISPECIES: flagellar protein FlaG [unclassified Methylophilus]HCU85636.1 flagellar biosynthesis protein FlaG [Methylophilus sp.]